MEDSLECLHSISIQPHNSSSRVGELELENFFCWHFFLSSSLDTQQLGNRHMEAALLATGNMAGEDPWQVEDLQHQCFIVRSIPTTAILSWLWSYCWALENRKETRIYNLKMVISVDRMDRMTSQATFTLLCGLSVPSLNIKQARYSQMTHRPPFACWIPQALCAWIRSSSSQARATSTGGLEKGRKKGHASLGRTLLLIKWGQNTPLRATKTTCTTGWDGGKLSVLALLF